MSDPVNIGSELRAWLTTVVGLGALVAAVGSLVTAARDYRLKAKAEERASQAEERANTASEAENDVKLAKLFSEVVNTANGWGGVEVVTINEQPVVKELPVGLASQVAAINTVAILGKKYPTLKEPARMGLQTIKKYANHPDIASAAKDGIALLEGRLIRTDTGVHIMVGYGGTPPRSVREQAAPAPAAAPTSEEQN